MIGQKLRVLAPLLCVAVGAACGGDESPRPGPASSASGASPTRNPATATPLAPGTAGKLGELVVTVSNVRRGVTLTETVPGAPKSRLPAAGLEWVLVHVRVENAASAEQPTPDVFAVCAGEQVGRFVYDVPGALALGTMPARSTSEGDLLFGMPPGCAPLTIRAARIGVFAGTSPWWAVP